MLFFFKRKKEVLDCFTSEQAIADLFPIASLKRNPPSWWKGLSTTTPVLGSPIDFSTVKRCPGIKDLFIDGFCIPAWSEYKLFKDPNQGFSHIGPNRYAEGNVHNSAQLGPQYENYFHFKFLSPWFLKQKKEMKWMMLQPFWHGDTDILVPPGVLEFKHQHSTHINIISKRDETFKEYTFSAGQPLAYLMPLTESKIEIKTHVVDQTELQKLKMFHHSFYNSYELTRKRKNNE